MNNYITPIPDNKVDPAEKWVGIDSVDFKSMSGELGDMMAHIYLDTIP